MDFIFNIIFKSLIAKLGMKIRWNLSNKEKDIKQFEDESTSNFAVGCVVYLFAVFVIWFILSLL
jgi:hypothetical protein